MAQAAPRGWAMENLESSFERLKISQRSSRSAYVDTSYIVPGYAVVVATTTYEGFWLPYPISGRPGIAVMLVLESPT